MAKSNYISMPVIRRLPRYYRHLTTLNNSHEVQLAASPADVPQKNCLKIWDLLPLKFVKI